MKGRPFKAGATVARMRAEVADQARLLTRLLIQIQTFEANSGRYGFAPSSPDPELREYLSELVHEVTAFQRSQERH